MTMKLRHNNSVGPQVRTPSPNRSRLLPIAGLLSVGLGLQSATQWMAYRLQYHQALGSHIGPVYPPWAVIDWAYRWHDHYGAILMEAGNIGVSISAIGLLATVIAKSLMSSRATSHEYLHGSARWADQTDIEAAGLLPRKRGWRRRKKSVSQPSVYVGAWADQRGRMHYLRHSGPEHVLCYAPTRSGKGVGLVIPTLLSWSESTVVTDLKGELWALTAGWRQRYARNKVLRFEPASSEPGGVRWNPMDEIRIGTDHEVGDAQNLATLVMDPDGRGLKDHWNKTGFALLVGAILHVIYKGRQEGEPASMDKLDELLANPDQSTSEVWVEMTVYPHVDGKPHPTVARSARDMLDRADEEASGVLSTAKTNLSLFRDPVVSANTAVSDFSIRDLMHNDSPVSLYIVTQPADKTRLRPLIRMLLNMILRLLADRMDFVDGRPVAHYKHRLLGMLDEFISLGKLEILQESLAYVAGYGIKLYLICQDLSQLTSPELGYGQSESITANCHVQNAFPPNRLQTAEHLSRLTGQTTVVTERLTTSGRRTSMLLGQVSRTYQETQRPLLTPDECLRMPGPRKSADGDIEEPGDMVIYVAGFPAIYGRQPLYFKDPTFQRRAAIPAPRTSDNIASSINVEAVTI